MQKPKVKNPFNIEEQFEFYLKLIKIDKRTALPYQLREMRRAFYGAWGIQLITQRDVLTADDEDVAVKNLDDMLKQCAEFWNKEIAPDIFNSN
jgi:hypothetical protein